MDVDRKSAHASSRFTLVELFRRGEKPGGGSGQARGRAARPDTALLLLPDQILEFDARSLHSRRVLAPEQAGSLKRFSGICASGKGGFYVSGWGGAGRLSGSAGGEWHWNRLPDPPASYVGFEEPFDWPGAGLLLTGVTRAQEAAALGFDGKRWRELYKGKSRTIRAWPGKDGSVWVQDLDDIIELTAGRRVVADKAGALTGRPLAVAPEGPGRFWIGTSQGLAHHMPLLWEAPAEAPELDGLVNAITEDRTGRIWFLSAHHLSSLAHSKWTSFPLPKGETPQAIFTDGLAALGDGTLVIRTEGSHLLAFDPVRCSFHPVRHPQDRATRTFALRSDGTLLVETFAAGTSATRTHEDAALETFDGSSFRPFLKFSKPRDTEELRSLLIGANGEIWAGGTTFFGVYRGPQLRVFDRHDGFDDPGAYITHQDRSGQMTAGGRDGLFRLRREKWVRILSGLDRVRCILTSRDGTMWVASGTGVHRFANGKWISNGIEEGLPSSVAYKVFEDSLGRIWAGTARGISLFHPEADRDPPMVTLAQDQNSRETAPGGRTRLVFSGIDKWKFTPPGRLLFSYRLDGRGWSVFSPATFASFEKLPAGPHRFEVRAMDRNGNISPVSAVHQFSVLLPWYRTPGFLWITAVSGTLIASLLTMAVQSYRHRGRLIQELNRKAKLERDRQIILQMIAGREPLPLTLQRIAVLAAENCPGATCVVLHVDQRGLNYFSAPEMPEGLQPSVEQLSGGPGSDEWWEGLGSIARSHLPGNNIIAPVLSQARRLGAVILFTGHQKERSSTEGWLATFSDLAAAAIENAGLYERLEHQAKTDVLTGLPNRLYFENLLESKVNTARSQGYRLAVLYLDLDRFKQVNDTLGHRVGDVLLKQVSLRLSAALSHLGTLARIGGDEFTVLIEHAIDKRFIEELATKLLAALRSPIRVEGHALFASASIGISYFPEDGEAPSTLQKNADSAMYRAKAEGRNLVKSFSAGMDAKAAAAIGIEELLHRALEEQLFELHYQPQYRLTGQLAGVEALLRLRNAEGVYLNPGDLIPVAEETGLIVPIGARVLREGCRQLREWLDEGLLAETRIAINVSAMQISRPRFAEEVMGVLSDTGIHPRLLELDLAESSIMRNLDESKRQLKRLRKLGVGIGIVGFGAGHSSLGCLQELPVDVLKIDRSFVQRISSPGGLAMIKAILALASNLQIDVVAVGVETESQLTALRNCKCDVLQGYLVCRPQSASAMRLGLATEEEVPVA